MPVTSKWGGGGVLLVFVGIVISLTIVQVIYCSYKLPFKLPDGAPPLQLHNHDNILPIIKVP